jgi:hypothetical protein
MTGYESKRAAARDKINGTKPMKIEVIKDYALPCMNAEHALKEAHQCMLNNHYDDAIYECTVALTYIARMIEAIKHMKEQDK